MDVSPRAKDHITRNPLPDMKSPLMSCWPGLSKRLPNHSVCFYFPWSSIKRWKVSLLIKTLCTSKIGPKGPRVGIDLNDTSLSTIFHGGRRSHVTSQRTGGRQPTVLPNYDVHELYHQPAWHYSPLDAVMTYVPQQLHLVDLRSSQQVG